MHDLVFKNARIIDGEGTPVFFGEVAVSAGRIVEVGRNVGAGESVVDVAEEILAPGIVDLHTHFDAQLTWDPFATPSPSLGVTTVVIGNCGFTIAPCKPADRDLTVRNLTHVEGMSLEALKAGVDWGFETYPEYLDFLERKGTIPNVASFVGHSSLRVYVMGGDASKRSATADEVAEMKRLLMEGLAAGGCGFATSTLEQHNGENGVPMPSRLADEHEMMELTGALGDAGSGVFMLTKGMTSKIPWLEKISKANGRPVMICAMFVDPNDPERVFSEFNDIESAQRRGNELWGQVGCFPLGMEFTLAHPYPLEAFIAWRPAIEAADRDAFIKILKDPSFRSSVKEEALTKGVPNRFSYVQMDHLFIRKTSKPENKDLVGKVVGELAREEGIDPFDWLFDFGINGELEALFECDLFNTDEERVLDLLTHPNSAITLSDAGAHLSFLCDAGFGLHLFGHWARDRGDMSLEKAVELVTSRPADIYRIKDRGRIKPGAWADLITFNPEIVGRGGKRRVQDLPAGAARIDTPAVGLSGVWINGTQVVDKTGRVPISAMPGKLLRDFSDS